MSTLKIAIQKSGRLNEDSIQILKDCGISINNGNDQLKATASNFPLEVLYLRNSDIPQYLIDGVVDAAIVGDNLLVEKGKNIQVAEKLGCSVNTFNEHFYRHGKPVAEGFPLLTTTCLITKSLYRYFRSSL